MKNPRVPNLLPIRYVTIIIKIINTDQRDSPSEVTCTNIIFLPSQHWFHPFLHSLSLNLVGCSSPTYILAQGQPHCMIRRLVTYSCALSAKSFFCIIIHLCINQLPTSSSAYLHYTARGLPAYPTESYSLIFHWTFNLFKVCYSIQVLLSCFKVDTVYWKTKKIIFRSAPRTRCIAPSRCRVYVCC